MPEGHSIRHYATVHSNAFVGTELEITSPQGRFAEEASKLNGRKMTETSAHGKHLFLHFDEDIVHIHLGLYGFFTGRKSSSAKEPGKNTRMRIRNEMFTSDLTGPTRCELIDNAGRQDKISKLGPDPIHNDAQSENAWVKIHKSSKPIGQLLMDQSIIAGIGNVYRAELLFISSYSPYTPGKEVPRHVFDGLWADASRLLITGSKDGKIRTVADNHLTDAEVRLHGHAHNSYVYKRAGNPCRVCGELVRAVDMAGRTLYWCSSCQK